MRSLVLFALLIVACRSETPRADNARARVDARATEPGADPDSGSVSLVGPTIIAFYPRATQAQVDSNADLATVLEDFSDHLSTARDSLHNLGFLIVQRPNGPIHLANGTSSREVVPAADSADVGYVFAAPGSQDRISYGVMTSSDLIAAGRAFLGLHLDRQPNGR